MAEEFEPASAAPVRRLRTLPRGLFEGRVCTAIAEARERRLERKRDGSRRRARRTSGEGAVGRGPLRVTLVRQPRLPRIRRSADPSTFGLVSQLDTPESVLQALDRTLATGCARVEFEFAQRFPPLPDLSSRRRGGLLRPLIRAGSTAGKRAFTAGLGKLVKDLQGEGYIDFRTHRCALDYGSYALIVVADRMWSGRSGRPVATLPEEPATSIEPMWPLDLVRGVTDVEAQGEELVSGRRRRHLRTHADMSRAAAVAPAGLPVPIGAARYSDLLHLPLELWLDEDDYIRRLRQGGEAAAFTLDLLELGADGPADWTRLPTFRSPQEADLLARRTSA